ncbi:hypothetical protein HRG84_05775 [Flavisolibacter sp. BT320]|nr:hypothetical protein [Flavisolibacter longurius]
MQKAFAALITLIVFATVLLSCQKDPGRLPGTPPSKTVKKVAGALSTAVQYEYNAEGNVTRYISLWKDAAGTLIRQNNVFTYSAGNRLVKWANDAGNGFYTYQNGRLSHSEHFAINGKKIATLYYDFGAEDRLTTVTEVLANPLPGGPVQTRVRYEYYTTGNVSRIDFAYRNKSSEAFVVHFSKHFVTYDNKVNPEPDGVLGAFLPNVVLMYNNPIRIENRAADGRLEGYLRYEYAYNNSGLPAQRKQYIATGDVEAPPLTFTYEY